MHSLTFEEAYPVAREVARQKAVSLVGKAGLTIDDCEDVAGRLLLTFYARFDRFDGERASVRTFASRVMERELASLLRYRTAECRRYLGEGTPDFDIEGLACKVAASQAARQHFWLDFQRALAPLPPALRETALALRWHTPSELSRLSGQTRTAIYRHIRRIREALLEAGVGPAYFVRTGGAR